jgi:DMSO/TMAO reductase YedYZ heme-binding membrane subunit
MWSLIADSYVQFTVLSVLVPFTSDYRSWAVSLGVFGFWLLVIIQMTSLMKKRLSQKVWRAIHMTSYPLYAIIAVHALTAGSDVGTPLYAGFTTALAMTGTAIAGVRWVVGRSASRRAQATA